MREVSMKDLARVVGDEVDQVIRNVKISLFNGVIRDTRVDTGRLRGNWQTTTGSEASGEVDVVNKIPQGSDGGSAQDDVIKTVKPDTVDYLTNNLPYSELWEQQDGMVSRNVARIDRIVREKARK
jgi:hypothetical protein